MSKLRIIITVTGLIVGCIVGGGIVAGVIFILIGVIILCIWHLCKHSLKPKNSSNSGSNSSPGHEMRNNALVSEICAVVVNVLNYNYAIFRIINVLSSQCQLV